MGDTNAYLNGIYTIIETAGEGLEVSAFAGQILKTCCATLAADAAALCTVEAGGKQAKWLGWSGFSPGALAHLEHENLFLDARFWGQVAFQGQEAAAVRNHQVFGSLFAQVLESEKLTSAAQAAAGQLGSLGCVLLVFRRAPRLFSRDDLRFLGAVAGHACRALAGMQTFDELALQYRFDPVTGMLHRRFFMELAEREFERSRRSGATLSLVLVDIVNMQQISRLCGHLRSDQLLVTVGVSLHEILRSVDLACRYGGNEFVVLLAACSEAEAARVAARIQERLGALPALDENGIEQCQVNLRLGITSLDLLNDESFKGLMVRADTAMFDRHGDAG